MSKSLHTLFIIMCMYQTIICKKEYAQSKPEQEITTRRPPTPTEQATVHAALHVPFLLHTPRNITLTLQETSSSLSNSPKSEYSERSTHQDEEKNTSPPPRKKTSCCSCACW